MYVEWSGQFEHQLRARKTLRVVFPAVIAVIVLILYLTYQSWIDAMLMMTSVLGALAGGAIFQWLFGFHFSVAVWVGYIACFGMATETGIVMLVYLREAIAERGGPGEHPLGRRAARGDPRGGHPPPPAQAADRGDDDHRDRPDALGRRASAPRSSARWRRPVLGGLLVADEVIDVFLPVLYFAAQKWRWRRLHGLGPFDDEVRSSDVPEPVAVASGV